MSLTNEASFCGAFGDGRPAERGKADTGTSEAAPVPVLDGLRRSFARSPAGFTRTDSQRSSASNRRETSMRGQLCFAGSAVSFAPLRGARHLLRPPPKLASFVTMSARGDVLGCCGCGRWTDASSRARRRAGARPAPMGRRRPDPANAGRRGVVRRASTRAGAALIGP
jgi:hypothetical protein